MPQVWHDGTSEHGVRDSRMLYGLDIVNGDLIAIQGKEKDRKTRTSLVHCAGPDFRLALAAARKVVARQRSEEAIIVRSMASTVISVAMPSF